MRKLKWFIWLLALLIISVYVAKRFYFEKQSILMGIGSVLGMADPENFDVYIMESSEIHEVAIIKYPVLIQGFRSKGIWPVNSDLTLQGMYVAKIGFKLGKTFDIDVNTLKKRVRIVLPPPEILSVQRKQVKVLGENQSIFNRMSARELANVHNSMDRVARRSVSGSKWIMDKAIKAITRELSLFSEGYGYEVNLQVLDEVKGEASGDRENRRKPLRNQAS